MRRNPFPPVSGKHESREIGIIVGCLLAPVATPALIWASFATGLRLGHVMLTLSVAVVTSNTVWCTSSRALAQDKYCQNGHIRERDCQ